MFRHKRMSSPIFVLMELVLIKSTVTTVLVILGITEKIVQQVFIKS